MPIVLLKVWRWLKRYWWVPVGVVLILAGFLLGGFLPRRGGGMTISPLRDVKDRIRENNDRIDIEEAQAVMDRDIRVAEIEAEHAETLARLDDDQKARAAKYRNNPRRLARWLTRIAKDE